MICKMCLIFSSRPRLSKVKEFKLGMKVAFVLLAFILLLFHCSQHYMPITCPNNIIRMKEKIIKKQQSCTEMFIQNCVNPCFNLAVFTQTGLFWYLLE